jgi:hypothetical protein
LGRHLLPEPRRRPPGQAIILHFLLGLLDCFDETLVAGHFLAEVAQPPEFLLQEGGGLLLIQGQ